MAEVTHLPGNCSIQDIIDVVEEQGAAVVDDFVSRSWLDEFNAALKTDIEDYTPPEGGEEFFGHRTVRTGKTLHGAGANTDGSVRRAIVTSYALGWLRTYENHFLSTSVEQLASGPKRFGSFSATTFTDMPTKISLLGR